MTLQQTLNKWYPDKGIDTDDKAKDFINSQWGMVVSKIIEKQGDITGSYPTNWVSREDVESQVNDERIAKGEIALTDKLMTDIARCIGESDTEYGTYWEALSSAYYNLTTE